MAADRRKQKNAAHRWRACEIARKQGKARVIVSRSKGKTVSPKPSCLLLAGAAMLASASPALAAGDWSGPYVGAHLGYGWGHPDYREPDYPEYNANPKIDGVTGGLLAGFNHQHGALLLGVEGDVGLADLSQGADANPLHLNDTAFDYDWTAHARIRVGYVTGQTLVFGAGGLSAARVTVDNVAAGWDEKTSTRIGWTLGGGIEQRVSRHLAVRIEYLRDDHHRREHMFRNGGLAYLGRWTPRINVLRTAITLGF